MSVATLEKPPLPPLKEAPGPLPQPEQAGAVSQATMLDGQTLGQFTSSYIEGIAMQDRGTDREHREEQYNQMSAANRVNAHVQGMLAQNPNMTHEDVSRWIDTSLANLGNKTPADTLGNNTSIAEREAVKTYLEDLKMMSRVDEVCDKNIKDLGDSLRLYREEQARQTAEAEARKAVDNARASATGEGATEKVHQGMDDADIEAFVRERIDLQLSGRRPSAQETWRREAAESAEDAVKRLQSHALTVEQRQALRAEVERLDADHIRHNQEGTPPDQAKVMRALGIRDLLGAAEFSAEDLPKAVTVLKGLGFPPAQLAKMTESMRTYFGTGRPTRMGKTIYRKPDGSIDYDDTMISYAQGK